MVKVSANMEKLALLMAGKNISQNRLAKMSGISSGYMSQIMTGKRNPSAKFRRRLLDALNRMQKARGLHVYKFEDIFVIGK